MSETTQYYSSYRARLAAQHDLGPDATYEEINRVKLDAQIALAAAQTGLPGAVSIEQINQHLSEAEQTPRHTSVAR